MRLIVLSEYVQSENILNRTLFRSGFSIDNVDSTIDLYHALKLHKYGLAILESTFDASYVLNVLSEARKINNNLPIIIISHCYTRSINADYLNCGADDCICIPINQDDLCARVNAVLRRVSGKRQTFIEHRGIKIDTTTQQVMCKGEPVALTRKEYCLLKYFFENIGRPTLREKLEDVLYSWEEEIESNTLVVHVYRLRKKFGNELIKTVRGFGYMIE